MEKPADDAGRLALAPPPGRGPIKRTGMVQEVFERIRGDILSLAIPPDTRISVEHLVRVLGVSQTPIREALSMLEASGLVTKKHFSGYCTAPKLNRKQFEQLYELRFLLEPYAASKAASHISDTELRRLCKLALQMEPRTEDDSRASYDRFADEDSEFHTLITHGSGNDLIVESLARLHIHLHIFRLRFHHEVTQEAFAEHAQIILALQQRDPDAAAAAMRRHLEKSYARLVHYAME